LPKKFKNFQEIVLFREFEIDAGKLENRADILGSLESVEMFLEKWRIRAIFQGFSKLVGKRMLL
jgi:hypothetical protein